MEIREATASYERWLAGQTTLVVADLRAKHAAMRGDPFAFLRATYYRWAQVFPARLADLADAPRVLAVGDLHVENFGTWRDAEGRLVWGVNEFDEVGELPYTNDLVRLAVTVRLAIKAGHLPVSPTAAVAALLRGYADGLAHGPRPFVLAEDHPKLAGMAATRLKNARLFWRRMASHAKRSCPLAPAARRSVEAVLPHPTPAYRTFHRQAGRGSLGKPRVVALAEWAGGAVAREAKAVTSAAGAWAAGLDPSAARPRYRELVDAATAVGGRCPDPFLRLADGWVIRRLAPDCSRIELTALREAGGLLRVVRAMGWETANLHHATPGAAAAIRRDLHRRARRPAWLADAARSMGHATRDDWEAYRSAE